MAAHDTAPTGLRIADPLIRQYAAQEITLQQLASRYGVSVATVWRELKRQGVSRGSRRGRPPSTRKRTEVLELARQGCPRDQIAARLGVTAEWVRAILAENGLAISIGALRCAACQVVVARGHKVYQGEGRPPILCLSCLAKQAAPSLAQRLLAYRLGANLSLAQLSVKSGLSRATIENYERDLTRPTMASTRKLARGLGVTLAALTGKGHREMPRPA
jgi:transcriptional regulator with XRE-family HTH domain